MESADGLNNRDRPMLRAALVIALALPCAAAAQEAPTLAIAWPPADAVIPLSAPGEIGVIVSSNFALKPAGDCGEDSRCGHIHMKIDPQGDTCNESADHPYNSRNSDFGGDLIKARFGLCPQPAGKHVIGVLLADDHHKPVLVEGKPVTALVEVTTTAAP